LDLKPTFVKNIKKDVFIGLPSKILQFEDGKGEFDCIILF